MLSINDHNVIKCCYELRKSMAMWSRRNISQFLQALRINNGFSCLGRLAETRLRYIITCRWFILLSFQYQISPNKDITSLSPIFNTITRFTHTVTPSSSNISNVYISSNFSFLKIQTKIIYCIHVLDRYISRLISICSYFHSVLGV